MQHHVHFTSLLSNQSRLICSCCDLERTSAELNAAFTSGWFGSVLNHICFIYFLCLVNFMFKVQTHCDEWIRTGWFVWSSTLANKWAQAVRSHLNRTKPFLPAPRTSVVFTSSCFRRSRNDATCWVLTHCGVRVRLESVYTVKRCWTQKQKVVSFACFFFLVFELPAVPLKRPATLTLSFTAHWRWIGWLDQITGSTGLSVVPQ